MKPHVEFVLRLLVIAAILAIFAALFVHGDTLARAKTKLAELARKAGPEKPHQDQTPRVVQVLIDERGFTPEQAWAQFRKQIAAAPRYRFQGRFTERLRSGHILVYGQISSVGHALSTVPPSALTAAQTSTLFGYPDADKLADHAVIDCEVTAVGIQRFTDHQGVNVSAMEYIYRPPGLDKPGDWMNNTGRTTLGERVPKLR